MWSAKLSGDYRATMRHGSAVAGGTRMSPGVIVTTLERFSFE